MLYARFLHPAIRGKLPDDTVRRKIAPPKRPDGMIQDAKERGGGGEGLSACQEVRRIFEHDCPVPVAEARLRSPMAPPR